MQDMTPSLFRTVVSWTYKTQNWEPSMREVVAEIDMWSKVRDINNIREMV